MEQANRSITPPSSTTSSNADFTDMSAEETMEGAAANEPTYNPGDLLSEMPPATAAQRRRLRNFLFRLNQQGADRLNNEPIVIRRLRMVHESGVGSASSQSQDQEWHLTTTAENGEDADFIRIPAEATRVWEESSEDNESRATAARPAANLPALGSIDNPWELHSEIPPESAAQRRTAQNILDGSNLNNPDRLNYEPLVIRRFRRFHENGTGSASSQTHDQEWHLITTDENGDDADVIRIPAEATRVWGETSEDSERRATAARPAANLPVLGSIDSPWNLLSEMPPEPAAHRRTAQNILDGSNLNNPDRLNYEPIVIRRFRRVHQNETGSASSPPHAQEWHLTTTAGTGEDDEPELVQEDPQSEHTS